MAASKLPEVPGLHLEVRQSGILHIVLNTPKNYNAFNDKRYEELIAALKYAEAEKTVKAVVLSSTGKFFSSGAQLSQERLDAVMSGNPPNIGASMAKRYIDYMIEFPKLLVAAIQGPAYGISVTTLPFFDLIYCSPEATFTTPFSTLGICLEGCSSVTFPALLGQTLSTRLLYLSETVPVDELASTGLIAEILPHDRLAEVVLEKVAKKLEGLSYGSIVASKSLVRSPETRRSLHAVNEREMRVLAERVASEDHRQALVRFQERRKQKKAAKL